jgi:hypothetical protein
MELEWMLMLRWMKKDEFELQFEVEMMAPCEKGKIRLPMRYAKGHKDGLDVE